MKQTRRRHWLVTLLGGAGVLVVLAVLAGACVQLGPGALRPSRSRADLAVGGVGAAGAAAAPAAADGASRPLSPEAAAAAQAVRPTTRQTVAVRRGTIAEQLSLSGRVGMKNEASLSFSATGRVLEVAVKPGQTVAAGEVLAKLDPKDIAKDLPAARARLETSSLRLAQLEAQLQSRQRDNDRRSSLDRLRQQQGVAEAEAGVRRADADLARVKAGPTSVERDQAAAAVQASRAALDRAEADLARAKAGTGSTETRAADQQVTQTWLALQQAEKDVARLKAGPDAEAVRAAERDLARAQATYERARADLDRVSRGADPYDLRAAEREVDRADAALRAAEATPADDSNRASRDGAIASARSSLTEARERLARLREGPKPSDVDSARRDVEVARLGVDAATEALSKARRAPDQLAMDTATAAVSGAHLAWETAQARYRELLAGADPSQLAALSAAVDSAKTALSIATARAAELDSHPTPSEVADAQDRLAAARGALERARAEAAPAADGADPATFDLVLLQKSVEQDRAQVAGLERDLAATQLTAPFAGVVAAVHMQPGDPVQPGGSVLTLAQIGQPVIRVDVEERQAASLAPGQRATVQLDGASGAPLSATVAEVAAGDNSATRVAVLNLALPTAADGAAVPVGAAAKVVVTLRQKDGVLLVPQQAVRAAGARQYVEYMDGANRRIVDVQTGIAGGGDVEILGGLREGQPILVSS